MADAELHIHITSPVEMGTLNKMIDAAVEARVDEEVKQVVPDGYRCASCFRGDGGHEAGCEVYLASKMGIGS